MSIQPGAHVTINRNSHVWRVLLLHRGDALLLRRGRYYFWSDGKSGYAEDAIRQVWPVSMLQLVAAAA